MRHAWWIRGVLAVFAAASFGIGCSGSPEQAPPTEGAPPAEQPKEEAPAPPPQDPGKIEAQDENWRK
ncbi:MAG TPA: hypothetical protein VJU16_05710, partial [Planctomycetota bacterium]|nr:hypothetical protein [Planctomycetota bacterium]